MEIPPPYPELLEEFNLANENVRSIQERELVAIKAAAYTLNLLTHLRRQQLSRTLQAQNLAMCEYPDPRNVDPLSKLGLVPAAEAVLWYETFYFDSTYDPDLLEPIQGRCEKLERLCQNHQPATFPETIMGVDGQANFGSTVIETATGRLFTQLLRRDVTHLKFQINRDFPEEIYAHFGLPALPKIAQHAD